MILPSFHGCRLELAHVQRFHLLSHVLRVIWECFQWCKMF